MRYLFPSFYLSFALGSISRPPFRHFTRSPTISHVMSTISHVFYVNHFTRRLSFQKEGSKWLKWYTSCQPFPRHANHVMSTIFSHVNVNHFHPSFMSRHFTFAIHARYRFRAHALVPHFRHVPRLFSIPDDTSINKTKGEFLGLDLPCIIFVFPVFQTGFPLSTPRTLVRLVLRLAALPVLQTRHWASATHPNRTNDNKGVPPRATVEVLADAEVVWLKSYNRGASAAGDRVDDTSITRQKGEFLGLDLPCIIFSRYFDVCFPFLMIHQSTRQRAIFWD